MRAYGLREYDFDGCMYGLFSGIRGRENKLLRKPWRICSDLEQMRRTCRKCNHTRCQHARVESADTKGTEEYTDEMVRRLHSIWHEYTHVHHGIHT